MEVELKIPNKINKLCDDSSRYALSGFQAVPSKHQPNETYLVVTNGRSLGVVETEGRVSEPCLIPGEMAPKKKAESNGKVVKKEKEFIRYNTDGTIARSCHELEGKFPRYTEVLPEATPKHLAVNLNPQLLLETFQALSGDNPESANITLLLPIPSLKKFLPPVDELARRIEEHWATNEERSHRLDRYVCFAIDETGNYLLDFYKAPNQFHAANGSNYDYLEEYIPAESDSAEDVARRLLKMVERHYEDSELSVSNAIPLLANGNFGVIMPFTAPGKPAERYNNMLRRLVESAEASQETPPEDTPEEDEPEESDPEEVEEDEPDNPEGWEVVDTSVPPLEENDDEINIDAIFASIL